MLVTSVNKPNKKSLKLGTKCYCEVSTISLWHPNFSPPVLSGKNSVTVLLACYRSDFKESEYLVFNIQQFGPSPWGSNRVLQWLQQAKLLAIHGLFENKLAARIWGLGLSSSTHLCSTTPVSQRQLPDEILTSAVPYGGYSLHHQRIHESHVPYLLSAVFLLHARLFLVSPSYYRRILPSLHAYSRHAIKLGRGYNGQWGADSPRTLVMAELLPKDTLKEPSHRADFLNEKEKLSDHALDVSLQDFVDTKVLEPPESVAIQVWSW